MGTSGTIVIKINGIYYNIYNHFDSYPDGLGKTLLEQLYMILSRIGIDGLIKLVNDVTWVSQAKPPTEEEKTKLAKYSDTTVEFGRLSSWYVLLRKNQGKLLAILHCGYCEAVKSEKVCSREEYVYIIDLDNQFFEGRACDNEIFWSCHFNDIESFYFTTYNETIPFKT